MTNESRQSPVVSVAAAVVPAALTFGVALLLTRGGYSTTIAIGIGILIGLLAGQVFRRIVF